MKYAFYPGCVSKGACPELYQSVMAVYPKLGITLEELTEAACTGAGCLQEKDQLLGDTLNARTMAMAEHKGLPIMTICSTCQGVFAQANKRLNDDPDYLAEINKMLAPEGLKYKGTTVVKHFLWVLLEDLEEKAWKDKIVKPLKTLRAAPFYGCYLQRPSEALGFDEHPERQTSLEQVIAATGAEVVDFAGKDRCCGLPILTINEPNSMAMVHKHTTDAKTLGADVMVTPCPLCHLNLDGLQHTAASRHNTTIDMPILHFPQLLGLAMGLDSKSLGLKRNIMSPKAALEKVGVAL
jgi:succinate dehydrogenase / fumarate reductase cytochrome b subunit